MDESGKETVSKVDKALAEEKGKREVEDDVDKESVKAKKQRVEEDYVGIKNGDKVATGTSSREDNSLESEPSTAKNAHIDSDWKDERNGLGENKSVPEAKLAIAAAVLMALSNNAPEDIASKKKDETGDGSDSSCKDKTNSAEDVAATKKAPEASTDPVPLTSSEKKNESNGDSDSKEESNSEDGVADMKVPAAETETSLVAVVQKKDKSSNNGSDSEEKTSAATETETSLVAVVQKKDKSSSNGSDSEEKTSAEDVSEAKLDSTAPTEDVLVTPASAKKDDSNSGSKDETNDDKETNIRTLLLGMPNVNPSSQAAGQDSGCSYEGVALDRQGLFGWQTVSEKRNSPVEYSEDEDSLDDEEDTDVEMADVLKSEGYAGDVSSLLENIPKTPSASKEQIIDSKTVFVGNLSFSIEQEDVENFFQTAGEIVGIRFAMNPDETFRGYGYVEFASAEAAEKAIQELNGKELLHRRVKLDVARGRGPCTPCASGEDTESLQKGGRAEGQTIFVRGFNKFHDVYQIRGSLEHHFGSCGEIERVSIPRYREGGAKGIAYVDFKDRDAVIRALELNGSEFEGNSLSVEEARPRGDHRDFAGGRRGGGRLGGRSGGWGFGGRFGGSWAFGGSWGRGGEGRGRGTPGGPNIGSSSFGGGWDRRGEGRGRGTPGGPNMGSCSFGGGWDRRGEGRGRGTLGEPRMGGYTFGGWDRGREGRGYRTPVEPSTDTCAFGGGWDRRGEDRGRRTPGEPFVGSWASGHSWDPVGEGRGRGGPGKPDMGSWERRGEGKGRGTPGEPSMGSWALGGSWDRAGEVKGCGTPGEPSVAAPGMGSKATLNNWE